VVEVFQNFERLTHDGVALLTLDVSHKAHATGVMFVGWVVQTLRLQLCFMGSRGHGAFLKNSAGQEEYCIAASMPRKIIGVRT
jgi:glucose-6-phosphate dehydrogenase assembly protein OpcA